RGTADSSASLRNDKRAVECSHMRNTHRLLRIPRRQRRCGMRWSAEKPETISWCSYRMQNARMPTSANLIQIVTTALASATTRSGPHLVCKPGCYQCCIGVFPIAHEDAARLREGLAALEQTDPGKAARIHAR